MRARIKYIGKSYKKQGRTQPQSLKNGKIFPSQLVFLDKSRKKYYSVIVCFYGHTDRAGLLCAPGGLERIKYSTPMHYERERLSCVKAVS